MLVQGACEWRSHTHQHRFCSVNDIEEKYYADGEDAYDMRKPFKDVKSKPAIVPKGSRQSQVGGSKKKTLPVGQAPASASPDSSGTRQPAAETNKDDPDKKTSDGGEKSSANASPGVKGKEAQLKAKAARNKKR